MVLMLLLQFPLPDVLVTFAELLLPLKRASPAWAALDETCTFGNCWPSRAVMGVLCPKILATVTLLCCSDDEPTMPGELFTARRLAPDAERFMPEPLVLSTPLLTLPLVRAATMSRKH